MAAPASANRPESSIFAFASDLADEGVSTVLDNVEHRAGLAGITPAFVYHAARDVFPHNPRRKVQLLDRGAFFFRPEVGLYDGLRIQPCLDPLARERDVLAETCRAAAVRGLSVHAWVVFLHGDRPEACGDCVTRNAFGDPYGGDLCPANPDVRAYVRALVADVARYQVTSILAESLHYHGLEHGYHHERYFIQLGARARFLLGLCFCDHCLARARLCGVEADHLRNAVVDELERVFADGAQDRDDRELSSDDLAPFADGELGGFLAMREETVASLAAEATEVADARGVRFTFLELSGAVKGYASGRPAGDPAPETAWRLGVDLARLRTVCTEVEVLGYAAEIDRVRFDLEAYRTVLGDTPVAVALRPSPPDCHEPGNLAEKVRLAKELGVRRVDFYHYGFLRLEALDWVRAALEAC